MGMFSNILAKLGFGKGDAAPAPAAPTAIAQTPTAVVEDPSAPVVTMDSAPVAMEMVDVVAQLEGMAKASAEKLNWRTSIVDLLKLLGMDRSLAARKELATELACPADKMGDSAQMNMWLHKTVLQRIAANGGNVPADLLD
jgi:hypothetical protein